jgi:hypothetical protein
MTTPISSIDNIIISITVMFIFSLIVFAIVGRAAFLRTTTGGGKSFSLMFSRGNFLGMITVLAVIIATLFLALIDKLSPGAVAIFSGVAGYVLGGMRKHNEAEGQDGGE